MSTKAYEGMRFRVRRLPELVNRITEAFKTLDQLSRAHEAKFMATHASEEHDNAWLAHRNDESGATEKPETFNRYVSEARREMRKRQREIKATGYRDPDVDSEIEIQVWLGPRGALYGYVHSEVSGVRDHLMACGLAEDFAYWNNTDRDPNISAARWNRRRLVWVQLFDEACGKSFSFRGSNAGMPDKELIRAAVPSKRTRARLVAESVLYPVWAKESGAEDVTVNNIGSTVMRFSRACRTEGDVWHERFEQAVQELEAELPELVLE